MAININITVPDASRIFDVDAFRTSMEQAMHKIAWEAQDFWVTIAGQRLKSSRIIYQPWNHPGFPGFNMRQDVVDYISDELASKHIGEAIAELMGS